MIQTEQRPRRKQMRNITQPTAVSFNLDFMSGIVIAAYAPHASARMSRVKNMFIWRELKLRGIPVIIQKRSKMPKSGAKCGFWIYSSLYLTSATPLFENVDFG